MDQEITEGFDRDWINLARDKDVVGFCTQYNKVSRSIKNEEFVD